MIHPIYLQVMRNGRTQAHVPSLPGCSWQGASPEEAMARDAEGADVKLQVDLLLEGVE